MEYYICHSWDSTKGNHAGMVHLFEMIAREKKRNAKLYVVSEAKENSTITKILRWLRLPKLHKIKYFCIAHYICLLSPQNSRVFLVEYFHIPVGQIIIANILHRRRKDISVIGFAHLVPSMLDDMFTNDALENWQRPLTSIVTLGSSLNQYLVDRGIEIKKIHTLFHYVDNKYYNISSEELIKKESSIIVMGALDRDFDTLYNVVNQSPDLHFILCIGNLEHLRTRFEGFTNVTLYGYLPEKKLKELMKSSSISLNIMNDTVGSNVITTSIAMGLAMVVSDVGSIRDYCNEENAIFCNVCSEYVSALHKIVSDSFLLLKMQEASLIKSRNYSIDNFLLNLDKPNLSVK